jgi:hypothetical protein
MDQRELLKANRGWAAFRTAVLLMCALAALAAFSGCSGNSPQGTAQRYLDYLQQFNYPACYGMLSEQDKKDRDFSEFLTAIPMAPDTSPLWFRAVLHSTHYEAGEVHREGDRAVVAVKVTTLNLPLWERTVDAAAGPDHIGGEDAVRSLDTSDYPKVNYNDQIVLTKEHHRWRVLASLAARDHIVDQYREAVALYDQSDFDGAAAAYRKLVAETDQLNATGSGAMKTVYSAELARTEAIIRERPLSQAYVASKLKLSDVAMKMSEDRVPGIFGTITNAGNRALDQVALAVTWYEGRGKNLRQVFSEQHAIVITPLQFTDFSRPVIPFLPGATRQFGFILTAPSEVQQNASPFVTVSAIVFTASTAPLPPPARTATRSLGAHLTPAPMSPSRATPSSKPSANLTPLAKKRPDVTNRAHSAAQP